MFNWLGNLFPYSDLHSLNLDWILNKMKETAAQAENALAQVIDAKNAAQNAQTAAQDAQTAAQDAQTAANKAAGNAASAAANAVQALNTAQTAQETATAANNKAQTAQETATAANNKAQTAQETATAASSAAQTAQETATAANSTANTLADKFPIKTADIADNAVMTNKMFAKRCAITTVGGKSTGLFPAAFTDPVATDISHITEELSPGRFGSLLLDTVGIYFQPIINFKEANSGEKEDIHASFAPFHFDPDTVGHAEYTPFIIENLTKNRIMRGYARIKKIDGANYSFQMFFDEAPVFTDGYHFNIEIMSIGGSINSNF